MDGIRQVTGREEPAKRREIQLPRRVHHFPGPIPIPGEVLVVENGSRASIGSIDIRDLLKELVAWVLLLADLVIGIVAMFADH